MYKKIAIILFLLLFSSRAIASEIKIFPGNNNPSIGQEFYVDLVLDTGGITINGLEGTINFNPEMLGFVRSENSKSFITHWIINPGITNPGVIKFSGIVPNGFSGFFNSTNQANNGNIMRLVFRPILPGGTNISISDSFATLNDGEGTISKINKVESSININNSKKEESYSTFDVISPELNAEIVTDPNLYENKKTLVFNATDKESGVEGVYLKKNGEWIQITNPHLLEENRLQGILTMKAVDFSGNSTTKRFFLPGYSKNLLYGVVTVLAILTVLFFRFLYQLYAKNKV